MIDRATLADRSLFGVTLAALFFYPIADAVDSSRFYLMWRPRDTAEFVVAFILLAAAFTATRMCCERLPGRRLQAAGLIVLVCVPLLSFTQTLLRALSDDALDVLMPVAAAWPLAAAAAAVAGAIWWWPATITRVVRVAALVLAPVTLVLLFDIATATVQPSAIWFDHPETPGGSRPVPAPPSVYVFLFDDLSYRAVYAGPAVKDQLPHLQAFSRQAVTYHAASSPGDATLQSMTGLLTGRRVRAVSVVNGGIVEIDKDDRARTVDFGAADGLLAVARAHGFRTEIVGWRLPYCRLLTASADACHTLGFWNSSTPDSGFSLMHPFLTLFDLWPHTAPFAVVSDVALARHQREVVRETERRATLPCLGPRPCFRLVHFSVPHPPFALDAAGDHEYEHPTRAIAQHYEQQLAYVDTVVGRLVARLSQLGAFDGSFVVLLADHEDPMFSGPGEDTHVPLIVKRPTQGDAADDWHPVRSEEVLRAILSQPVP